MTLRAWGSRSNTLGRSKDLQVELLIELWSFALGRGAQELGAHRGEDAVVAGGMIAQGVAQLRGHERGVAGNAQQVLEAGGEFFTGGVLHRKASTNAAAQGQQFLATQVLGKPQVACEHNAQARSGV